MAAGTQQLQHLQAVDPSLPEPTPGAPRTDLVEADSLPPGGADVVRAPDFQVMDMGALASTSTSEVAQDLLYEPWHDAEENPILIHGAPAVPAPR